MAQVSYGTITITDTTDLNTFIRYAKQLPLQSSSDFQLTPDTYTHYIAVLSIPSNEEEPSWNSNKWKWSEFIGTDGLSVKSTRILYYLKTNASDVPVVDGSTSIASTNVQNAWTSINPTYVTNGTYWTCLEVTLSDNITKSWSTPVQDLGLTSSNATANDALAQATNASQAVSLMGGHFVYKSTSSGNSTSAGAGVIQNIADNPANWGYNTWIGANGIQLRRGETADATLNANGLTLANGGIVTGTAGQSGFVYLSTKNYGSYSINNSSGISDWKEIIGTKFGVRADGTLYANNAIISGQIIVENGSDLSAGLGDYSTTTAMNTAISTATNDMATQTYVLNNYATQTSLNTEISQRKAQYGTSSTGASTRIKAVTCSNFELVAGNEITIKFSYANTQYSNSVQLNINNKGAKDVWVANAITSSSNQLLWGQNAYITFRYDGTQFIVIGEPRTWYGASTTPADTAAKTDTTAITGCVICKGAKIELAMSNNNTNTSATLNIQSTGAKNIYYGNTTTRPTVDNGHSWLGTSTATFTFDGAYYRMAGQTVISGDSITTGTISANRLNISDIISNGSIAVTSQIPTDLSDLNNDTGYITSASVPTKVSQLTNDSGFQNATQVNNTITEKGYQTASDVSGAINTATSGLATKGDAVYRTQRIYYRKTSNSAPNGNTTWLTSSTSGTGYGNWSLSIPQLTSGTTKYPFLYTAIQTQTITQYNSGSGTACSCSAVLLDNTTTIIDGGAIIAGSITANEINGSKLSAIYADMGNITAGNITKGYNSINFDNTPATLEFKNASSWNSATQGIRYNSNGLDVKGAIYANTGYIGGANGWTIESQKLYSGTIGANNSMYLSTKDMQGEIAEIEFLDENKTNPVPWRFTVGSNFGITADGTIYATGANIKGTITITDSNLSNVYTVDEINANVSAIRDDVYGVVTYEYISGENTYVVYPENIDNVIRYYYIGYTTEEGGEEAETTEHKVYLTQEQLVQETIYDVVEEEDLVGNPQEQGWYELVGDNYTLTEDTEILSGKEYYKQEERPKEFIKGTIAERVNSLTTDTAALAATMEQQYNILSNKEDLSLIAKGYASISNDILTLFKQNNAGEIVSALELTSAGIDLKAEGALVATMRNDNGIGIMRATNMEQTFVKMIQADGTELFQWIAQSNGHLSLKKM